MKSSGPLAAVLLFFASPQLPGQSEMDHSGHHMTMEPGGMVMNENTDTLPRDCSQIARDYQFTIHAGRDYASDIPGMIFGLSEHEIRVEPCSRITVTFVNEDEVRHQWMVHGLPVYQYPAGMFHIEADGGHSRSGTFIVPGDDRTYLVHCDMAQHMEKGMRGQIVVGRGSGDLWSVSGISDDFHRFGYIPRTAFLYAALLFVAVFLTALVISLRPRGTGRQS